MTIGVETARSVARAARDGDTNLDVNWRAPEVREFVVDNELSLLLRSSGIEIPEAEGEACDREKTVGALAEIAEVLRNHDIEFCVIKFPEIPKPMGDIDILIPDQEGVDEAFRDAGYLLEDETPPHRRDFVKIFEGKKVVVDIHTGVAWSRVEYVSSGAVLTERVDRTVTAGEYSVSVPVPCPEHDLLITAAHALFDNNAVNLFEVLYGVHLMAKSDFDRSAASSLAASRNWREPLQYYFRLLDRTQRAIESDMGVTVVAEFPVVLSVERVLRFRVNKLFGDLDDGNRRVAATETLGYTQDLFFYIFGQRLGFPVEYILLSVTFGKKALKHLRE
jgi:hypothetical protein